MRIELKNIKYSEFASEETHCYEASLYINGKRVAKVGNDGHGGCDWYHGDYNVKKEVDVYLAKKGNFEGYDFPEDLEMRCCDLVNDWLEDKELKAVLKKVIYIKNGDLRSLKSKYKPTPEVLAAVQKAPWWSDDCVMVSGMPFAEAKQVIKTQSSYFG